MWINESLHQFLDHPQDVRRRRWRVQHRRTAAADRAAARPVGGSVVAGRIGLPYAASAIGSKAAVRVCSAEPPLRMRESGVGVTASSAGFVVSRLSVLRICRGLF